MQNDTVIVRVEVTLKKQKWGSKATEKVCQQRKKGREILHPPYTQWLLKGLESSEEGRKELENVLIHIDGFCF